MADDKVRELAADIGYAVAEVLGYVQAGGVQGLQAMLRDNGIAKIAERIIRTSILPLLESCEIFQWMAEKYAEGGGENGPEMRDYKIAAAELRNWRKE